MASTTHGAIAHQKNMMGDEKNAGDVHVDKVDQVNEADDDVDDDDDDDVISDTALSEMIEDEEADNVGPDIEKLQRTFPDFQQNYRLLKKIGEGTFSTVYKAEDLNYDKFDNSWDCLGPLEPPSLRRRRRYVAVKKIYVTSSPQRILNELELLHEIRGSPTVSPLITAVRSFDQVVLVLPYFAHADFRDYYRSMSPGHMRAYFTCLFHGLAWVHKSHIIHRDIKPTNFLYDPARRHGVLVDFGLAEKEWVDKKQCMCLDSEPVRQARLRNAPGFKSMMIRGYPRHDMRPHRRANRAGTRGFRPPEVLFKCTAQTCKVDVWSAGVILLTILTKRFPFFNSADDIDAMIELMTLLGTKKMRMAGLLHGVCLECSIPTAGANGHSFEAIVLWSTCRLDKEPLTEFEVGAVKFLEELLDVNPATRLTAEEALRHPFLRPPERNHQPDAAEEVDFV